MHFTSITAAVLLGCSAAVVAQSCNPVPRLNDDNTITVTGLGSRPDYTLRIESDGTPFSVDFVEDFCSEVTTACSGLKGAELEDEIAFCVADSEEFLDYTMAQVEQMVAEAQRDAGAELQQLPPLQQEQQSQVQPQVQPQGQPQGQPQMQSEVQPLQQDEQPPLEPLQQQQQQPGVVGEEVDFDGEALEPIDA